MRKQTVLCIEAGTDALFAWVAQRGREQDWSVNEAARFPLEPGELTDAKALAEPLLKWRKENSFAAAAKTLLVIANRIETVSRLAPANTLTEPHDLARQVFPYSDKFEEDRYVIGYAPFFLPDGVNTWMLTALPSEMAECLYQMGRLLGFGLTKVRGIYPIEYLLARYVQENKVQESFWLFWPQGKGIRLLVMSGVPKALYLISDDLDYREKELNRIWFALPAVLLPAQALLLNCDAKDWLEKFLQERAVALWQNAFAEAEALQRTMTVMCLEG